MERHRQRRQFALTKITVHVDEKTGPGDLRRTPHRNPGLYIKFGTFRRDHTLQGRARSPSVRGDRLR